MIKKFIHTIGVSLAMFSILWIITGSTIEFHQKYVYENNLDFWNITILKSSSKDYKKFVKYIDKNHQSIHVYAFTVNSDSGFLGDFDFNLSVKNIYSRYLGDLLTPEYIIFRTLRGPPVC
ncbi:MAG: hypothetical protein R2764_17435 [Bacteroidales bacterium]